MQLSGASRRNRSIEYTARERKSIPTYIWRVAFLNMQPRKSILECRFLCLTLFYCVRKGESNYRSCFHFFHPRPFQSNPLAYIRRAGRSVVGPRGNDRPCVVGERGRKGGRKGRKRGGREGGESQNKMTPSAEQKASVAGGEEGESCP